MIIVGVLLVGMEMIFTTRAAQSWFGSSIGNVVSYFFNGALGMWLCVFYFPAAIYTFLLTTLRPFNISDVEMKITPPEKEPHDRSVDFNVVVVRPVKLQHALIEVSFEKSKSEENSGYQTAKRFVSWAVTSTLLMLMIVQPACGLAFIAFGWTDAYGVWMPENLTNGIYYGSLLFQFVSCFMVVPLAYEYVNSKIEEDTMGKPEDDGVSDDLSCIDLKCPLCDGICAGLNHDQKTHAMTCWWNHVTSDYAQNCKTKKWKVLDEWKLDHNDDSLESLERHDDDEHLSEDAGESRGMYIGELSDAKDGCLPQGLGVWSDLRGCIYSGQWSDGIPDGQGERSPGFFNTSHGEWSKGSFSGHDGQRDQPATEAKAGLQGFLQRHWLGDMSEAEHCLLKTEYTKLITNL
jgi:hypothetical protein